MLKSRIKKISLLSMVFALSACGGHPDVIGEVNGKDIFKTDFQAYLNFKRIPQQDQKRVASALDQYLQREGLADVIEKTGLLDQSALNVEIDEFKKQMLISRYFEAYLNDKVTEEAVRNFYNTHPDDFQHEQAKVAHILIRVGTAASQEERRALLTKAQEIHSKLSAGEDFAQLAKHYSEDTISAKQGGELGWLKRGAIDPVFSENVFALKKDEMSPPFPTPFGFHIVKLLEAPQVIKTPFEKVKGDIRYRLRQEAKAAEHERLMAQVKVEKKQ